MSTELHVLPAIATLLSSAAAAAALERALIGQMSFCVFYKSSVVRHQGGPARPKERRRSRDAGPRHTSYERNTYSIVVKGMFINQIFKIVQIVQICGDCPEGRWSTSRLR